MFFHRNQGLFWTGIRGWYQNDWTKTEYDSTWKKLDEKGWSWRTKTSFLDRVYLQCIQPECKPNETIIEQHKKKFESRISAGATEKLPWWEKPHAQTVAWSYHTEGHVQKCVERFCELANKVEQLCKVSSLCLDDHQCKQEDLESVGESSQAHTLFWNDCHWHELVDLTSCGHSTSLGDQSLNGQELVTDG